VGGGEGAYFILGAQGRVFTGDRALVRDNAFT